MLSCLRLLGLSRGPTLGSSEFGSRDVTDEHTHEPVDVLGEVPNYVRGTFYRQSGGAFVDGTDLVDGLAHVSAWHIGATSSFSNRFVQTRHLDKFRKSNGGVRNWVGVGGTAGDKANYYENLNVNFERTADGIAAASPENPFVQLALLDASLGTKSLEQMVPSGSDISSASGLTFLASHHFEAPNREDLHGGVFLRMLPSAHFWIPPKFEAGYAVYRATTDHGLPLERVYEHILTTFDYMARASVPLEERVPYMHSMLETSGHVIFIISSKRMRYDSALAQFPNGFFAGFPYEHTAPLQFEVLAKRANGSLERVGTCVAPTHGHVFHTVNAYDAADGTIVADMTYSDGDAFDGASDGDASPNQQNGLCRFTLDLAAGTASQELLSSEVKEFASCNQQVLQKPHRYVWGLDISHKAAEDVVKVDTRTGQSMRWSLTSGWVPSEPQFVPRPGGVSEDDGVLLLAANEIAAEKSWLLVLDAKSLTELARLPAPIEVNTGLHNMFVPDAPSYPIKN